MSARHQHTIVVGVDGSDRSVAVLQWAAAQAEVMGAAIKAVNAWHFPEVLGHHPARMETYLSTTRERIIDALVEATCDQVPHRTVVQEDEPAHLLLREAKDAELVVLGSQRGQEGLGRIATAVLHEAACPVVFVPVEPSGRSG
jgi:nucleotide-binding universal stress UspA family protein